MKSPINSGNKKTVQVLLLQIEEQERQLESIKAQLADKDLLIEVQDHELAEMKANRVWKIALLLRRIRLALVPPRSLRARASRRIINLLVLPFKTARQNRRIKQEIDLVKPSGLFEAAWYLENNPDVARSGIDPLRHFLLIGGFEGRDPGGDFSIAQYVADHREVKRSGLNPLVHYLIHKNNESIRVVFVSGESLTPGHVYRVERYAKTYQALGLKAAWFTPMSLAKDLSFLDKIKVLIIWRTPYDFNVRSIIEYAKRKNILIVFDIDDLMFDARLVDPDIMDAVRYQKLDIEKTKGHFLEIQRTMAKADVCTCPTQTLAAAMENFGKKAFVLPNGYDYEQFYQAVACLRKKPVDTGLIRIGYAGGTQTHQKDFRLALPALIRIIKEYPNVIVTIFGEALDIREFPEIRGFEDRFESRKMVPVDCLLQEIARFNINLAPLEINPFCEAKSEIKYYEAALVKVPTIASPTLPYKEIIRDGINGFLAYDGSDWYKYLKMLIDDAGLRVAITDRAYQHVLWYFSPEQRAWLVYNFLDINKLSYETSLSEKRKKALSFQKKLEPLIKVDPYKKTQHAEFEKVFEHMTGGISKVGVVIPLFNYESLITEALNSTLNQTLQLLDLVIVDDCSTDNSLEVARKWLFDHKDRFANCAILHNLTNQGLSATRNIGFEYLQTPWIMPLDADNILLPDCLEKCLAVIQQNHISGVYTAQLLFGEDHEYILERYGRLEANTTGWDPELLPAGNYIDAMALISKAAWANVGGYDTSLLHGWEDFDFWLKFIENGLFAENIPERLAKYRVHKKSMLRSVTNKNLNERRNEMIERHPWVSGLINEIGDTETREQS